MERGTLWGPDTEAGSPWVDLELVGDGRGRSGAELGQPSPRVALGAELSPAWPW